LRLGRNRKKQSPEQRTKALQQVAEDSRNLIDRFADDDRPFEEWNRRTAA